MKKQKLHNLVLHKKTISSLEELQHVHGGANAQDPLTVKSCKPQVPMTWIPRCHSKYSPCPML